VVVTLLAAHATSTGSTLPRPSGTGPVCGDSYSDNIRAMPLHYLQNVGRHSLAFLYDPPKGKAPATIRLYPDVAYCLGRFHGLIAELVQAAWTRWVHQQILPVIGDTADLHEFLFGAERASLGSVRTHCKTYSQGHAFVAVAKCAAKPKSIISCRGRSNRWTWVTTLCWHIASAILPSGIYWRRKSIWPPGGTKPSSWRDAWTRV